MTQANIENVINANANFAAITDINAKGLALTGIQADYREALKADREAKRAARRDARREQWDSIPTGGKVAIFIVGGVAVAALIVGGVIIAKKIFEGNAEGAPCCSSDAEMAALAATL